jgi:quinol monooxygenase YgiN
MKRGPGMIIVTGEVRFGEGEIGRLHSAMEKNIHATRAEPGCARYAYSRDILEPDLLHVVEEWSDEEAVDAHMQAPHMAELMGALATAKIEALSINGYSAHFLRTILGEPAPAGD